MIDRIALTRSRIVVLALIAAAFFYKVLNALGQGDTSLMFIGLPAILAVIVTFSPPSKSATGTVMKVMTLMLLLSGILLIEGAVCILMAAPLFYGIGALIGLTVDQTRKRKESMVRVSLIVPLTLLAVLGVVPGTTGPRVVEASAERIVEMSLGDVREALGRPARFDKRLPAFFRLGRFPRPLSCEITDGRFVIDFEMLEPSRHKLSDGSHHAVPSRLVLRITESVPGRVVFEPESDTTMMSHWAELERSVVEWARVAGGTRVRWTLRWTRKLDPSWYFGPMQSYAGRRAAAYLIDSVIRR